MWRELAELQDPELKRLAKCLPDTVMHSRADSTTGKYMYAFQRWKAWAAERREVTVFPVQEVYFALYLQHLGEVSSSKSAVGEAVNAVSWVLQISGLPPISESPFVRATLSGLQRKLSKPKVRKEPVTVDILSALVGSFGQSPTLTDIRLGAIALLSFAAFLRYDEVAKLRCCDITFTPEAMLVAIKSSKTDQYRQGEVVPVARTGTVTCPVKMMEHYYKLGEIAHDSSLPLFRGVTNTKHGQRLRTSGSLSYTRMRELFLGKLGELGLEASKFGLHSLRAGGATAAANAGVADRLFKRHGRWRSESAKDGYVDDSSDARLSVSKSLKL